MVKFSVFYPHSPEATFDMEYYAGPHMALVRRLCGPGLIRTEADSGLAGGVPGAPPRYIAVGHLYFESVDAFQAGFPPNAAALIADVPNFTNVQPDVQLSELRD